MDVTQWYALALAAVAIFYVSFYILRLVVGLFVTYIALYFLKHLYYPPITRSIRAVKNISRFEVLMVTVFLLGNIVCITWSKPSMDTIVSRTGMITVVNLIPLALGNRLNMVASRCGIGTQQYERLHRWLGWIATAEGLTHGVIASVHGDPALHRPSIRAAIVVSAFFLSFVQSSLRLQEWSSPRFTVRLSGVFYPTKIS